MTTGGCRPARRDGLLLLDEGRGDGAALPAAEQSVQAERSKTLVVKKAPKASVPRTLWEVHQAVMAVRPSRSASLAEWQVFRCNAAELYSAVADVDRPHRDEALYWANSERARADRLSERIATRGALTGGAR